MIHDFAKKLYDAGSAYRHGGAHHTLHRCGPPPAGKKPLDVLRGYRLLRRLMLHGLAVVQRANPQSSCATARSAQTPLATGSG